MEPAGWNFITDAMGRVSIARRDCPLGHIPGIDIAGKTGSAPDRLSGYARQAPKPVRPLPKTDGLWDSPLGAIRTSSCVYCFEGGEHGRFAARFATQIIKAYVEKRDRNPRK